MSKLSKLPPAGRNACIGLADNTKWSAEEWARSLWTLDDAGLFPDVGLTHIYELSAKTGLPPNDVANVIIEAARKETMKQAQQELNRIAPTPEQLAAGIDLTAAIADSRFTRVTFLPNALAHEKTTVCNASSRDYPGAPHLHACQRLERHGEHETGRAHACKCGGLW